MPPTRTVYDLRGGVIGNWCSRNADSEHASDNCFLRVCDSFICWMRGVAFAHFDDEGTKFMALIGCRGLEERHSMAIYDCLAKTRPIIAEERCKPERNRRKEHA